MRKIGERLGRGSNDEVARGFQLDVGRDAQPQDFAADTADFGAINDGEAVRLELGKLRRIEACRYDLVRRARRQGGSLRRGRASRRWRRGRKPSVNARKRLGPDRLTAGLSSESPEL